MSNPSSWPSWGSEDGQDNPVTLIADARTLDPRSARAGAVLEHISPLIDLAAKTAIRRTTTQIYEGTNQIQRMVMARQLLK